MEIKRNPVSKHQFSLSVENEQTNAGRDGLTRLAEPNSQALTGTGKCLFYLFSLSRAELATLLG